MTKRCATRAEYEEGPAPLSWRTMLFIAGVLVVFLAIPVAILLASSSDADLEDGRWERCVSSAREFGFEPAGGVEAWCLTNGGVR